MVPGRRATAQALATGQEQVAAPGPTQRGTAGLAQGAEQIAQAPLAVARGLVQIIHDEQSLAAGQGRSQVDIGGRRLGMEPGRLGHPGPDQAQVGNTTQIDPADARRIVAPGSQPPAGLAGQLCLAHAAHPHQYRQAVSQHVAHQLVQFPLAAGEGLRPDA